MTNAAELSKHYWIHEIIAASSTAC